ncbi:TetR/AcrR family transcriptional regulator [Streptomyces cylindrosporus]|uniref:TetR/AcrR family transcriptional regulator n=1 Tax=Streptomyces cylindrosporus TaxID=2927583 RepID=A0ABS9XZB6_9ACTN|nr:TetR/AcrR family transcriptional regulator [Streptomyces cylindrosporus]MCI3269786.1 TetR/AcrR family transcriptional regulator [Streptomyces cylindrosporus]
MSEGRAGSTTGARGADAESVGDGRRNQKLRTRRALVDAAVSLVREGRQVTIADAAQVAQVSVATAYRYFSNPQELLRETKTVARGFEAVADLPEDPAERLDLVVSRIADMQLGDEAVWRAVLIASLTRWTEPSGDDDTPIRNRRRLDVTRTALEPLAATLPPEVHRRLTNAVNLVYGVEALVTTRDVCELDPEEAKAVMRWAAGALLERALREAGRE